MGLFSKALEQAERAAEKREQGGAADVGPTLVAVWPEVALRDRTGVSAAATSGAADAVPPNEKTPPPGVRFDAARLGLAASETGLGKEQYRILRTRVLHAMRGAGLRSLLITSAGEGEGKTTVAANLALQCSALRQGRVLLIDADLRRAGLSAGLRPAPEAGLDRLLRGEVDLEGALHSLDPWLSVLPTWPIQEEGAELLASQRMVELLRRVREQFDLVLLDGAPIDPIADSRILVRLVDASLLVVRAGIAPTAEIEEAAALLRPGLLGSVLNGAAGFRHRPYPYATASAGPLAEAQP